MRKKFRIFFGKGPPPPPFGEKRVKFFFDQDDTLYQKPRIQPTFNLLVSLEPKL
jgi:hypothetical protein